MKNPMMDLSWITGVLRRRRGIALAGLGGTLFLGLCTWMLWPRTYHASFSLELQGQAGAQGEGGGASRDQLSRFRDLLFAPKGDVAGEYRTLLRRHDVVDHALKLAGVIDNATPRDLRDYYMYRLRQQITITQEGGSSVMTVFVEADSPERAEKVAKGLMDALELYERESRTHRIRLTLNQLSGTQAQREKSLEKKRSLVGYYEEVDRAEKKVKELRAQVEADRGRLEEEIATRVARRSVVLDGGFSEEWHEVRTIDRDLRFLKSFEEVRSTAGRAGEIDEKLTTWRYEYQGRRDRLQQKLDDFDHVFLQAMDRAQTRYGSLATLKQEIARDQQNLATLKQEIARWQNTEAASAQRHKIIKEPVKPRYASTPETGKIIGWTLFLAIALAGIGVYLREMTDTAANSVQEVRQVARADALALIPHMNGAGPKVEGMPLAFGARGEALPHAEAFRTLKSNILFAVPRIACPVILITSSLREEGKSTTTANLALAFAEDRRTLVLSCNMRRPTLHKVFNVAEQRGMVDVLEGKIRWQDAVRPTRYRQLSFIPHGRLAQNSSVLLARPAFERLLKEAREKYDVVLIDSPPATLLIDAVIMASKADASIVVYSLGETEKEQLRRAMEILRKVEANVLGVAVNIKLATAAYLRGYYYYYQQEPQKKEP